MPGSAQSFRFIMRKTYLRLALSCEIFNDLCEIRRCSQQKIYLFEVVY